MKHTQCFIIVMAFKCVGTLLFLPDLIFVCHILVMGMVVSIVKLQILYYLYVILKRYAIRGDEIHDIASLIVVYDQFKSFLDSFVVEINRKIHTVKTKN